MTYGIAPFTPADDVTPIIAAWKDAFSDPPHGHRSVHDLAEQLAWHGTFPGFTGLAARDTATSAVLGMVYGFSNRPGQWWRDRVAAVIGPDQTRELLDDSFCLMELGVMRAARRQGIAQALVNELLARQTHPRVLLSMQSDNRTGLAFYRATGWSTLVAQMSFGMGYLPYDILLREVPHPGTSSP